jgi:hypothetical protein
MTWHSACVCSKLLLAHTACILAAAVSFCLQVSQLLCVKEQLEFDVAAQQAQSDELTAMQDTLRAQVQWMKSSCVWQCQCFAAGVSIHSNAQSRDAQVSRYYHCVVMLVLIVRGIHASYLALAKQQLCSATSPQ